MTNVTLTKLDILLRKQMKKIIQLFAKKTNTSENFVGAGIYVFIQGC